jgi:hypothetical protein
MYNTRSQEYIYIYTLNKGDSIFTYNNNNNNNNNRVQEWVVAR